MNGLSAATAAAERAVGEDCRGSIGDAPTREMDWSSAGTIARRQEAPMNILEKDGGSFDVLFV